MPRNGRTKEEWKAVSTPVQAQVAQVIKTWVQDHWSHLSQPLICELKSFIDNDLRLDGNLALVKVLSAAINSKVMFYLSPVPIVV